MCAAILLAVAAGKQIIIHQLGVVMTKEPIRLQKSLDDFDEAALSPYIVRNKGIIGRETLESLGTEEYLQWTLENPDVEIGQPPALLLAVHYLLHRQSGHGPPRPG